MKLSQLALGVVACAWVAALLLAPDALRPLCGFICHQRPERSFFLGGSQLPVCARCTGLYVGAAVAAPLALVIATRLSARGARAALAMAALPTALTWTLEFTGIAAFSNVVRFVAALPLGSAAAWLVLAVIGDD